MTQTHALEPTAPAEIPRPDVPLGPILGMLLLMWSASVYSAFGLSAYPRQEWLIETLVSVIFLIPVVNFFKGPGSFSTATRFIGLMLLVHSMWDALHWPGLVIIQTPIDPRIPKYCPFLDLPVGAWLLARGR
jgi:hypothetical protein